MSFLEKVTREKAKNPAEWQQIWQFWLFGEETDQFKNVYIQILEFIAPMK